MNVKKEVLYDVEWQVLRVSMLSENNKYGGWWTEEGVLKNSGTLMKYIAATNESEERAKRIWRALNLCNATLLGYGNRDDVTERMRNGVTALRDKLSQAHLIRGHNIISQSWNDIEVDLHDLWEGDKDAFMSIYKNLKKRQNTSARRNGGTGLVTRPELGRFLGLMDEVKRGR